MTPQRLHAERRCRFCAYHWVIAPIETRTIYETDDDIVHASWRHEGKQNKARVAEAARGSYPNGTDVFERSILSISVLRHTREIAFVPKQCSDAGKRYRCRGEAHMTSRRRIGGTQENTYKTRAA